MSEEKSLDQSYVQVPESPNVDESTNPTPGKESEKTAGAVSYFLNNFVLPNPDSRKLYIKRLNATNSLFGSYGGHDTNLAFVGYGLLFLSESLRLSVPLVKDLAPKSHLVLSALSKLEALPLPLRKLSDLISDIRIFNRLWGLIPLSVWAADTWARPPEDPVQRKIVYAQVLANLVYQPLENVAYLAMHGVLPVSPSAQGKLWIYSCYLWALHVVLELFRLSYEYRLAKKEAKELGKSKEKGSVKVNMSETWWRSLVTNVAYFPLTLHWSLETGCLSDLTVGFLGTAAAIATGYPNIKNLI